MKERPILFSAPMMRAILAGNKTQTRRIAKNVVDVHARTGELLADLDSAGPRVLCPYGQVGDRLWVRETWRGVVEISPPDAVKPDYGVARYVPDKEHCKRVEYAATEKRDADPWRPSIHMPHWASRILLEITGVRVERLQNISQTDAYAEGAMSWAQEQETPIKDLNGGDERMAFMALWESIGGAGSWDANPWVWVIEFRRVK